ncbi:MAG: 6-pyruvoyl-tetrahydropterin synthase-related protein [Acidobacteriota bacterium]
MIRLLKRFGAPMLAAFAGVGILLPLVFWGIPNNNDLANHYHFAVPFYEAIKQGNLLPGWLATSNFGYGDPVVRFYPPALYYLMALGRAITGNWYAASLFALMLVSALGSLGAYFWARSFVPARIAVWAAVFYAFMPYHLAEVYQAAQLAEFAGGAALMFALGFTKRVCDGGRTREVLGLATAYALLVLSHLPLAVFGSVALMLYALMSLPKDRKSVTVIRLATSVGLGLAASAFHWVRLVAELNWILADGINPDPLLDYRKNFIFSSFSPEKSETIWWMGLLLIGTLAMFLPALVTLLKRFGLPNRRSLIAIGLLTIFSLLMCTSLSKPIWVALPFLRLAQHPFRWLAVGSVAAPIVMAASVPFWVRQFKDGRRPIAIAMAGLVIISITFSVSQTIRGATYLSRTAFEQMLQLLNEAPGINQWLPVWANAAAEGKPAYEKCAPPVTGKRVEAGTRTLRIGNWQDLTRTFEVGPGSPLDARVATFYYPHWIASTNGQTLPTRPGDDGALLISLPPEQATVSLEFREPPRTMISIVASIISWTLLASLLIFGSFADRRRQHDAIASRPAPARQVFQS